MSDEEISYIVASNNEVVSDDVGGDTPFVEIAIRINVGTYQCRVVVWLDSRVELLNPRGQMMMSSYVLFQGDTRSTCASSNIPYYQPRPLGQLFKSVILNMKRVIMRVGTNPIVYNSQNLSFMIETLEKGHSYPLFSRIGAHLS
ncbi:hypothetical protein SUGI_0045120 [Cryptomeria japonica]|nr:hypothetical protein SUGI_0045120 [Cryptomeria japonica]